MLVKLLPGGVVDPRGQGVHGIGASPPTAQNKMIRTQQHGQ